MIATQAALAGALTFSALTVLYALVWWRLRAVWALYSVVGNFAAMLFYALDPWLQPVGGRPQPAEVTFAVSALALLAVGFIRTLPLSQQAQTRWQVLLLVVLLPPLPAAWWGLLTQRQAMAFAACSLAFQAGLAGWAAWREPRSGYALLFGSTLLFPLAWLVMALGFVEPAVVRYAAAIPVAVNGMTLLTIGLLRAQRLAHRELAQREAAQAQLERLNATLEEQVQQRTAELRDLVSGLESFNRSVSHDLRGPLGGIAGVSRLAVEALDRGDLGAAQRLCQAITAQAETSQRLVEALLVLARMEDVQIEREPVPLGDVVGEVVEQMRLADLQQALPPVAVAPLPVVQADPVLVRQVYANLIGNAVKFARGAAAPHIEVGAQAGGDGAPVLFVRDNGVGFDTEQAQRLFQPFQRLHGSRFPGHGVGLSIVRRVVERHGGRIWAESRPGQGATFYFTLGGA
jgi:signal transduction histidine kinase